MCLLSFDSGVIAQMGVSWAAHGRKASRFEFEVNGSEGSVYFNLEWPGELQIYSANDAVEKQGYKTIFLGPAHQ